MQTLPNPELRVLGALVEKQISTPEYYPLTLNALVNACNQKNHRDPVVDYTEADVLRALDGLRQKQLAFILESAAARVPKYTHNFPAALTLDAEETAVLCVLLLRGPQTPGELRSRTPHLHQFESLAAVEATLQRLVTRAEPLVVKLPRAPGTKEARFAHLLGGEVTGANSEVEKSPTSVFGPEPSQSERLSQLEAEVAALRKELEQLRTALGK